jgi:hypothetical protein
MKKLGILRGIIEDKKIDGIANNNTKKIPLNY